MQLTVSISLGTKADLTSAVFSSCYRTASRFKVATGQAASYIQNNDTPVSIYKPQHGTIATEMYWCFGCGTFRQAVLVSKVCKLLVYGTQASGLTACSLHPSCLTSSCACCQDAMVLGVKQPSAGILQSQQQACSCQQTQTCTSHQHKYIKLKMY